MSSNKPSQSNLSGDTGQDLKSLGKYRIERKLGAGGMGTVYLAVDPSLNRPVALKVLPKERAENPILVRRFKAEGQAAAILEHKNIIRVYDAGEADGYLYLALEYVDGIDVLEWMRKRGVIPVKRSLDIIRQVAEALKHSNSKNIVHRDIKPSNLMIARDGTVKLADMGLARSVDETLDTSITRDGTTVGTVDYMSPEQASNSKAADIRSDIYSLGCTWYHMLVGTPPFNRGGVTEKLTDHARKPPPDPREINGRVSEAIVAVLHRMMAKKQEDRYQTPEQLLEDLNNENLLRGGDPSNLLAMLIEDDSHYGELEDQSPSVEENGHGQKDDQTIRSERKKATPLPRRKHPVETESPETESPGEAEPEPESHPSAANRETPRGKKRRKVTSSKQSVAPTQSKRSNQSKRSKIGDKQGEPSDRTPDSKPTTHPVTAPEDRTDTNQAGRKGTSSRRQSKTGAPDSEQTATSRESASGTTEENSKPPEQSTAKKSPSRKVSHKKSGKTMPPREGDTEFAAPVNAIKIDFKQVGLVLLTITVLLAGGWWLFDYLGRAGTETAFSPYSEENLPPGPPEQANSKDSVAEAKPLELENMDTPEPDSPQDQTNAAAVVPEEISRFDFPGLDDQKRDAEALRALLPEWVLQGWGMPNTQSKNDYRIGRGLAGEKNAFTSLQAGLEKAPVIGATLELSGTSIYTPDSASIERCQHLVIKAADDDAMPVVWINGNNLDQDGTWLSFGKGTLELDGIHFVVNADLSPAKTLNLLRLNAANVIIRNCSFTIIGDGKKQTQLVTVHQRSAQGNRILWENCLIQGVNTTALVLATPQVEVIAGNCLIATSGANVIDVLPSEDAKPDDARLLTLMGCSLITNQTAIRLVHDSSKPSVVPVTLELYRSLLVATPGRSQSTAIRLENWPLNSESDLNAARPAGTTLNLQHTRLVGWKQLTFMKDDKGATQTANNESNWRQFWRKPLPSDDLLPAVDELSKINIATIDLSSLGEALKPLSNAGIGERALLGCVLDELQPLPAGYQQRFLATACRRRLPDLFGAKHPVQKTVRFDLKRIVTLQNFIDSPDCPNGTHVVCFGGGLKQFPPLVLENRRLRIEFEQAGDAPLTLRAAAGTDQPAMLTLNGGQLDLVNGNFELPESGSKKYPATFIQANGDASFSVRNCQVTGPAVITPGIPLIDMTSADGAPSFCAISDSILIAKGPVFQANLSGKAVEFDNSLLVSGQNALQLRGGEKPGNLLLHQSTLSASAAAVHFSAAPTSQPIDVFVKDTVFAPGFQTKESDINCILATDDQQLLGNVLRWWDSGTAYSDPIPHFINIDGKANGNNFRTDWDQNWGSGHAIDVLNGPQAVTLATVLDNWSKLQATHFALKNSCKAYRWTEEATPVGIDIDTIGPDLEQPAPAKTTTPGKAPVPNSPPAGRKPSKPKGPDF